MISQSNISFTPSFISIGFKEPNPPEPFRWPVMVNNRFRLYSVRPESRGNKLYWYMRKQIDGTNYTLYLGPTGKLSVELLNNAALQLEASAGL